MEKRSVIKNYIYNVLYQIFVIFIPIITTPYLSRVLGAENIGIYSYTLSITTYFILFGSLGVAMYGKREIAYLQDDLQKRTETFFEILCMRFITVSISLIFFYFFFCLQGEYKVYYVILLLEIIANSLDISWFFQGIEEFKKTVFRNLFVKLVSVICIFLFVKTKNDLGIYLFIYVLSNLFGNLSLWLYVPSYIVKIDFKKLRIQRHLKPTIWLFIPQIATQVYTVLDKTMIGIMIADKSEVGYYEQAQKIVKLLLTLATSFGTVMMPRIAHTFANGDRKKVRDYMNRSFGFIMMLAFPLMFGLIAIAHNFVPLFYGVGYDKVIYLLCIISPIIVFIGLSNVIGTQYLLTTKQQTKYTVSVVVGAVANFLLNLLLIRNFQSLGASVATVVAECLVTVVQFYYVRKEFSIINVIKTSYKYVVASVIVFLFNLFINLFLSGSIGSILFQLSLSAILYISLLVVMRDKLILEGIDFIFKVRRRRNDEGK